MLLGSGLGRRLRGVIGEFFFAIKFSNAYPACRDMEDVFFSVRVADVFWMDSSDVALGLLTVIDGCTRPDQSAAGFAAANGNGDIIVGGTRVDYVIHIKVMAAWG